jgi:hypothetical protein
LRATPVGKRNIALHLATTQSRRLAVIASRKRDVPLKIAAIVVYLYVAGLMLLGPNEKERDCIALVRKYKRPFAAVTLYAPAR